MIEHAKDVIPVLWWMVGAVSLVAITIGGALVSVVMWVFKELKVAVDGFPEKLEEQHDELLAEIVKHNTRLDALDIRMTKIETYCSVKHSHGYPHE